MGKQLRCKNCNEELEKRMKECPVCGKAIKNKQPKAKPKAAVRITKLEDIADEIFMTLLRNK